MPVDPLVLVAMAGIVVGVVLSALSVARLVRLARQPELARAPIAERSPVTFAQAGRAELAVEGPFLTTRFRGLGFALADETGVPVHLRRLWFKTSSSGLSRTRLSLYGVEIPRPGSYTIQVTGIDPASDYGRCAVLFVRPIGAIVAVTVVSLLASIGLAAGGIATTAALLLGPSATEPDGASPDARPSGVTIPESRGGRALASDPARLGASLDVDWPALRMHVRVPADWVVHKLTATEIDLRDPRTPSTFLTGRVTPMPAGPRFDEYLTAHVTHARDRLASRLIDGYATKRIGEVPGVLTLERREDGAMHTITWTGFQPAAVGSLSITLLVGAAGEDFAREETLLGAIFESISFD